MKISTRGRYALRMLMDMVRHQDRGPVSLKDIAERQNLSQKYLEQIALALNRFDIMHGSRGHQGGYRLLVNPADLTIYQILTIVEGSMAPVSCLDNPLNECPRKEGCHTLFIWEGLDAVVREYLSGITLQDVIDRAGDAEDPGTCPEK